MKHLWKLFFCITIIASCSNSSAGGKKKAQVKGKLTNSAGELIMLVDVNTRDFKILDSAKIDPKGEFAFYKKVPDKGFYNIKINDQNFCTVILDSTEMLNVEGSAKDLGNTYKVDGSKDSQLFWTFNDFIKKNMDKRQKVGKQQDSLRGIYNMYLNQQKAKPFLDSVEKVIQPKFDVLGTESQKLLDESNAFLTKFVDENASSWACLAALSVLDKEQYFSYFQKVDEATHKAYPNSNNLKPFHSFVENLKRLAPGAVAPDITLNTPEDKALSLSSLKGKIVLVDFWASWCAPCRAENPNVVKAYQKYKDKGFDVFGVSLDMDKTKWTQAIQKDGLTWHHVSELKGWGSACVQLYGFSGIPYNVLLDKEGKIIGKALRGDALEKKLEEVFK